MIHVVAVLIVIMGIALINYSKWIDGNNRDEEGVEKAMVSGSVLALVAAFCYALSNVLQEKV
jgi:drug/metabolite transporter (DMT)-like permease